MHLPLEAVNYEGPAEPGGVTLDMSRNEFRTTFASAIETVPFAIGVSSHRGSLLTRHPGHMTWLMQEIRERDNLFFIDSYTTPESIALKVAAEEGVSAPGCRDRAPVSGDAGSAGAGVAETGSGGD